MEIRVSPSQLKLWAECREKHRIGYLLQKESIIPGIHLQFGKVIHKVAQGYWAGKPYMESFHDALALAQELDPRLLTAAAGKKWTDLQESIAPIATIYYGTHGECATGTPAKLNEAKVEWEWGSHAGVHVICNGIIDRLSYAGVLVDTKTASAVGGNWKADLKKRLLREPQMGFYLRYLEQADYQVSAIEYEVIVKSYRGSEPYITAINVTEEILEFQKVFMQQMDWAIREMCEFYISCREVEPWPMSNTSCITQWGECEYLPVCSGTKSLDDPKLYKIKEPK